MSGELSGNVNNQLNVDEHEPLASAKKVVPKHLSETSGNYVGPTCQEYTDTIPLNVVLCDPTAGSGTPYLAPGTVTSHIAASVTLNVERGLILSGTTLFTARHCGVDTTYLVADANLNRVSISIGLHNPSSTGKLFLGPSAAMSTGNAPIQVNAGQSWDEWGDGIYTGEWYGIASNVTATAHRWDRSAS